MAKQQLQPIPLLLALGVLTFGVGTTVLGARAVLTGPQLVQPQETPLPVVTTHPAGENTLQIKAFYPSPTPTVQPTSVPTIVAAQGDDQNLPICPHDSNRTASCRCGNGAADMAYCPNLSDGECYKEGGTLFRVGTNPDKPMECFFIGPNNSDPNFRPPEYLSHLNAPGCTHYCYGKPVIYLYPTKQTIVSVSLEIPGSVTVSDPLYPQEGWEHIDAHPDGSFMYEGRKYHELFYETDVRRQVTPQTGTVVAIENIPYYLSALAERLGLSTSETAELTAYWIPKLHALHQPYIFVSVLTPSEKDSVDRVHIQPQPDTMIEMLFYFKPLDIPFDARPLQILPIGPKRNGFTVVEWGGTIAN